MIASAWACAAASKVLLAVQDMKGDGAVRGLQFAEQLLCGGDFVVLLVDIDMRQDQVGFGVKRVQQLGCFAVGEIVEASPEHLAIERDGALRSADRTVQKTGGMAAESLLEGLRIKPLEDVANRGMRRRGSGVSLSKPISRSNDRKATSW
jgi:hypothetical protein